MQLIWRMTCFGYDVLYIFFRGKLCGTSIHYDKMAIINHVTVLNTCFENWSLLWASALIAPIKSIPFMLQKALTKPESIK